MNQMFETDELIRIALEEDIGPGDVTTDALIEPDLEGEATIFAKESLVLAGLKLAQRVFLTLDADMSFEEAFEDGNRVKRGDEVLRARGKLHALLAGERTALNFLQHLSGIATLTRQFVDHAGTVSVRLTDTRKTTPGWRVLEKYAVRVGGGHNHRFGLYDGILIKDNHIKACGGITEAVRRARNKHRYLLRIEVEVTNLEEVEEALANGVDVIMLDNMRPHEIRKAVKLVDGHALVEVSGGVALDTVAELASTGVDIISIGALTHSARAVDISMNIIPQFSSMAAS
ncbi:MAG: carboxylating nicotinate-nucleotide diphosphorylase [Deltaproteobacteria bacterium]|nr:MAG: carboxylating nicotinate-nucleotide diphosphorylase [Deltaproteobacteria bacterium]